MGRVSRHRLDQLEQGRPHQRPGHAGAEVAAEALAEAQGLEGVRPDVDEVPRTDSGQLCPALGASLRVLDDEAELGHSVEESIGEPGADVGAPRGRHEVRLADADPEGTADPRREAGQLERRRQCRVGVGIAKVGAERLGQDARRGGDGHSKGEQRDVEHGRLGQRKALFLEVRDALSVRDALGLEEQVVHRGPAPPEVLRVEVVLIERLDHLPLHSSDQGHAELHRPGGRRAAQGPGEQRRRFDAPTLEGPDAEDPRHGGDRRLEVSRDHADLIDRRSDGVGEGIGGASVVPKRHAETERKPRAQAGACRATRDDAPGASARPGGSSRRWCTADVSRARGSLPTGGTTAERRHRPH